LTVCAFVPRLAEVCAELAAFGVPETIQHDDLHDGQAFVRGDSLRVLDWGDSCVSHPFATLLITLDFVREDTPFDADALRRHYLSAFGEPDALVRAAELAEIVGAVTRALKWAPIVAHLGRPPELRDHVARRLRLLVDG
jgi:Ser/Thr protein kinase RdoA (MazF antagonist)